MLLGPRARATVGAPAATDAAPAALPYNRAMTTLEVQLPDDLASRIERAAETRGVSVDELVRLSVQEKLARDDQFAEAARLVLSKNAELYERLS